MHTKKPSRAWKNINRMVTNMTQIILFDVNEEELKGEV